ncbi:hypothetical protein GCM10018962_97530 [Dactylosporangium matsuzakiense]|uniref:hypothetical protein n=1 Tax=Dactylosporangium matsuzakiense TaxID=53360 RepID=UPI0031ED3712
MRPVLGPDGRRRVAGGLAAALAALGLVALGPVGPARADAVDQISGNGTTDSAVTVRWDKGLLGRDNTTVVKPRDPADSYAFMHKDFQNLEVTVGQTRSLVHQAIKVTWKGFKPTLGAYQANYLQVMECYGDTDAGPLPENCQYGSLGMRQSGSGGSYTGVRNGTLCASHTPSATSPVPTADGSVAGLGCDPAEDPSAPGFSHRGPTDSTSVYTVPFVPVGTTTKIYDPALYPFKASNTNEIQQAGTRADGTGDLYFNTLTRTEAPGLGCGAVLTDGRPRDCWLVIVPRGEYEPNGWKIEGDGPAGAIQESPLGAGSWAQRLQIHLGYNPLEQDCPIGSAKERQTQGTELVSHAVVSWQLALNAAANCKRIYGYSTTPEGSNTTQLGSPDSEAGLAFTNVVVGSEAVRNGSPPPALPPIVYMPVAVSAAAFAFNVNLSKGYVTTPIKLTPRLLAKALTQSYQSDLTQYTSTGSLPAWARQNPDFLTRDKEFIKLNPDIGDRAGANLTSPLLTAEHSGVIRQIWAWILTDQAARDWLGGKPDEYGMVINDVYQQLNLGRAPLDAFPRPNVCFDTKQPGEPKTGRCTLDLLPYLENFDESASHIRAANSPHGADWDPNATAPGGTAGWWKVANPIQFPGQTLMWGVMDTASMANYGLVGAELCKADGTGCVAPTTASVGTAVANWKRDEFGLPQVDPANPGAGGYPLSSVTYAAVRLNLDLAARSDYAAFVKYAVNEGQQPGVNPGQLPHGYLSIPASLRTIAMAGADLLLLLPDPLARPTPTATGGAAITGNGNGTSGNTGHSGNTGAGSTASGVPDTGARPSASAPSPAPFTTTSASPVAAAQTTPALAIGVIRWALVIVLVAGLGGAVGGPLLRLVLSRRPEP